MVFHLLNTVIVTALTNIYSTPNRQDWKVVFVIIYKVYCIHRIHIKLILLYYTSTKKTHRISMSFFLFFMHFIQSYFFL